MNPHRWQRLEAVFFGALETPAEERRAYLDRVCADDAELRAEVEAVLAAHAVAGGPDPVWLAAVTMGAASESADALIGTRIGAHRLDERIGHGGMGVVYRAHRVDEQYQREVAIKLVRSGLDADEMTRRFRVERQILANLQHPNIATLLEGGITEDGQPYLVMPYVRGVPITTYAETHALTVRDRLRLFRTVCNAVQYAHANLVVHRDLKPSNILVTDDGDVRLLDFGIAKLLAPETAGVTAVLTTDAFLLTPEHAAPEQLQRRPVTTATDVYALGVLLYELLTGVRPFRSASQVDLYRAICEHDPTRPSAISPQLPGDLDPIVLMALRKDPTRRYASAGQLAEDVTRFLEGRPVLARPDSIRYRARRFIGRNRTAVSLAGAAALSLVAGLIGTASQA
ncbi:MAG: serine/threonine-protein kinase, partial [Longimicrobiales bacterium]